MSAITQKKRPLYTGYAGSALLETPLLNKGSAFTAEERAAFNLTGLLPPRYETIEEQVSRCYQQYRSFDDAIKVGVARAQKTLRNLKSAWVQSQQLKLDEKGNITEYRVQLKVTFIIDD